MRILRLKEVMKITGLSRSSIYKYMSTEEFPSSIKLGQRSVGWIEDEINQWLEQKTQERKQ